MNYNDCIMPSIDQVEKMAKAYSLALKKQGYAFVKINQDTLVGVEEVVIMLRRLAIFYSRLDVLYETRFHKNLIRKALSLIKSSLQKYESSKVLATINVTTYGNRIILLKRIMETLGSLIIAFANTGENSQEIIAFGKTIKDLSNFY